MSMSPQHFTWNQRLIELGADLLKQRVSGLQEIVLAVRCVEAVPVMAALHRGIRVQASDTLRDVTWESRQGIDHAKRTRALQNLQLKVTLCGPPVRIQRAAPLLDLCVFVSEKCKKRALMKSNEKLLSNAANLGRWFKIKNLNYNDPHCPCAARQEKQSRWNSPWSRCRSSQGLQKRCVVEYWVKLTVSHTCNKTHERQIKSLKFSPE